MVCMCMLLCEILSVQLCFHHLPQGSVCPLCFCFVFLLKNFFFLIIIFYFNNFILFYPTLFYFILFLFLFLFFLPFILSCVDERHLVLQPGIRAVPLRWESQLQDTGPQETSQLHVIPFESQIIFLYMNMSLWGLSYIILFYLFHSFFRFFSLLF